MKNRILNLFGGRGYVVLFKFDEFEEFEKFARVLSNAGIHACRKDMRRSYMKDLLYNWGWTTEGEYKLTEVSSFNDGCLSAFKKLPSYILAITPEEFYYKAGINHI